MRRSRFSLGWEAQASLELESLASHGSFPLPAKDVQPSSGTMSLPMAVGSVGSLLCPFYVKSWVPQGKLRWPSRATEMMRVWSITLMRTD